VSNYPGDSNNEDYQNSCNSQARQLHQALANLRDNLGSTKGAALLRSSSELQTLVKDTVNIVKASLNGLDGLVEEDPLLQLLLGDSEHPCRCHGPPL
jgi:hypothetical protein